MIGDRNEADLVEMAEDAIERNLQVIGEAANHLPEVISGAHPDIAWPQIRGFLNILVHRYFGVDFEVVRDVVEVHLPPLAAPACTRVRAPRRSHAEVHMMAARLVLEARHGSRSGSTIRRGCRR